MYSWTIPFNKYTPPIDDIHAITKINVIQWPLNKQSICIKNILG